MKNLRPVDFETMEFKNLTLGYSGSAPILEDASAILPTNSVAVVKGALGSGKSSVLRYIAGLEVEAQGQFLIDGQDVNEMSFEDFLPYRLNIGYSFDYGGLLNNKTIKENLSLPLYYHNQLTGREIHERVDGLMEEFGLVENAHQRPASVSGGMRKAACVARAFAMAPKCLILDDPTTGLNIHVRKALKDKICSGFKDKTLSHVYICSQDFLFLNEVAKKQIIVKEKKILIEDYIDDHLKVGVA